MLCLRLNLQNQLSKHVSDVELSVANNADVTVRELLLLGRSDRLASACRAGRELPGLRAALSAVVLRTKSAAFSFFIVLEWILTAIALGSGVNLVSRLGTCDKEDPVIMLVVEQSVLIFAWQRDDKLLVLLLEGLHFPVHLVDVCSFAKDIV